MNEYDMKAVSRWLKNNHESIHGPSIYKHKHKTLVHLHQSFFQI